MSPSIGYWRDIDDVERLVPPSEEVQRMAGGEYAGESGIVVATDKQVLFIAFGEVRWAMPTSELRAPRCDCGALFATLTIKTRLGSFTVRRAARRDGAALVDAVGGRCSRGYRMRSAPAS